MMRFLLALLLATSLVPPASSAESDWTVEESSPSQLSFRGQFFAPELGLVNLHISCIDAEKSPKSSNNILKIYTISKDKPSTKTIIMSKDEKNWLNGAWFRANLIEWIDLDVYYFAETPSFIIETDIEFAKDDALVFQPQLSNATVLEDNKGLLKVNKALQKYGHLCE